MIAPDVYQIFKGVCVIPLMATMVTASHTGFRLFQLIQNPAIVLVNPN